MNRSIVRTTYAPSADLPVHTDWRTDSACQDEDPDRRRMKRRAARRARTGSDAAA
ncbi:hypothetical protein [Streptomyces sp. t39]|uniref:hypothetical protein n=1 Tax=Streptomyces sp. t39 TaxID=1828156 RepID=UPI00164EDED1|nr:hypothetical protein [Streptomyces sp. t39]